MTILERDLKTCLLSYSLFAKSACLVIDEITGKVTNLSMTYLGPCQTSMMEVFCKSN